MQKQRDWLNQNKHTLLFCIAAVFIWGILAHGYNFLDNNFSHDSLNEFNSEDYSGLLKIRVGRFCVPFYWAIFRGNVTLPWLSGCMALLWVGLSVFLISQIFHIRSNLTLALIAGVFSTNVAFTCTSVTYLHDLDADMFSLLCAVGAAWLWSQNRNRYLLFGSILIALSLGFYQGYVFVSVTIIMVKCIVDLLNKRSFQTVFTRGLYAIFMLIIGVIMYFGMVKIVLTIFDVGLYQGDIGTLDRLSLLSPVSIPKLIILTYKNWLETVLLGPAQIYSDFIIGINVFFLFLSIGIFLFSLFSKCIQLKEKILLSVLFLLLPLGMFMICLINSGLFHALMTYPLCLFYVIPLILSDWFFAQIKSVKLTKYTRIVTVLLLIVILWGNVRTSNRLYLKRDIEYDAYSSLMTRVVYRMEMHEDYVPAQTPVVFVGLPEPEKLINYMTPGFLEYRLLTGTSPDIITNKEQRRYYAYFNYVMGMPLAVCGEDTWNQICDSDFAKQMPAYPDSGCIAFQDDIMIVKLGNDPPY